MKSHPSSDPEKDDVASTTTESETGFPWMKLALVAVAFLVSLVYLIPESKGQPWKLNAWNSVAEPAQVAALDEPARVTQTTHPKSYYEDKNPAQTTYCSAPYSPTKPLVQFVALVYVGAASTRLYIYKFNNCGPTPSYEYEEVKISKDSPLHFNLDNPGVAAETLEPLLQHARLVVPTSLHSNTAISVKVTEGLTMLPAPKVTALFAAVEGKIKSSPFKFQDKGSVSVMHYKDDVLYAWLSLNFLLGNLREDTPLDTTRGIADLGNGITGIVFERTTTSEPNFSERDHMCELRLGGKSRALYRNSYFGYGLMTARGDVHRLVKEMNIDSTLHEPLESGHESIGNPCLAKGTKKVVSFPGEGKFGVYHGTKVTMEGSEMASFEACRKIVQRTINKDAMCAKKPCVFNGVYRPSIVDVFPGSSFFLLNYFSEKISPLIPASELQSLSEIADLAEDVCHGSDGWQKRGWNSDPALVEKLKSTQEWCLDLTFIYSLLQYGYELPNNSDLSVNTTIHGTDVEWTLGAALLMIEGSLTCGA